MSEQHPLDSMTTVIEILTRRVVFLEGQVAAREEQIVQLIEERDQALAALGDTTDDLDEALERTLKGLEKQ